MVRDLLKRAKHQNQAEAKTLSPHVAVRETEKDFLLQADMPGLAKEDIQTSLDCRELVIAGSRKKEEVPKGYSVIYQERTPMSYRRTFTVNAEIDQEHIKAVYEGGVLNLTLPKSESVKPKKITVQ